MKRAGVIVAVWLAAGCGDNAGEPDARPGRYGDATRIDAAADEIDGSVDDDAAAADAANSNADAAVADARIDGTTTPDAQVQPCPANLADAVPYSTYTIDATQWFAASGNDFAWTVTGQNACDVQFLAEGESPSWGALTGASASTMSWKPTLQGNYVVDLTVTPSGGGAAQTCRMTVKAAAPGLRVELCSDHSGVADVDLHLHRPGTTTPWFTTTPTGSTTNQDDCFYATCTAGVTPFANWGYANSPLASCSGTEDGAAWSGVGHCKNPRMDSQQFETSGVPEVVAVDLPVNGSSYRAMVHYYGHGQSGTLTLHPIVNVYCGGTLAATYGVSPQVTGFNDDGGYGAGDMWRVADIVPTVSGGNTTGCTVSQLNPPGQTTGFWVTTDDRTY